MLGISWLHYTWHISYVSYSGAEYIIDSQVVEYSHHCREVITSVIGYSTINTSQRILQQTKNEYSTYINIHIVVVWYKKTKSKKYPSASYNRRKTFNLYQQTIKCNRQKIFQQRSINVKQKYFTSHPKTNWQKTSSDKLIHQWIIQIIPTFQGQICSKMSFEGKVFCLFCNVFFRVLNPGVRKCL